ncbi:MAG: ABC transporter substrate-binding protein [Pseudomonadota bacterium]|jgi:lysine-arginine-ornithine-binding protein|uniref:ABC transporter substrate-binding protein n=1 Tax=Burkholderiaceae TaxID=119060 RepID=UPI0010F511F6|nr:ABC transporter substrate-binding protein [Burkholderia sp. 4M9327F10]
MKKLQLICAIALVCASAVSQAKTWTDIRMGVEGAYPPFNEMGTDGKPKGFDVDIGNALCAQLHAHCTWVVQDWDGMIPALMSRKFDTIMSSMTITNERREKIAFTDKYYAASARLVAKAGAPYDASKPASLAGKRVGVQRSTPHETFANAVLAPAGATVVSYPTQDEVFADLRSGRIDTALQDTPLAASGFLNMPQGAGFAFAGAAVADPKYFGDGIGIGVRKEDADLVEQLDKALAQVRASGEYARIAKKYFNFDIYTGN